MNFRAVFYLLGRLFFIIGALIMIPACVSFYYHDPLSMWTFLLTSGIALSIALILVALCQKSRDEGIGIREGFLLVTLSWCAVSLIGAVPYYLSFHFPSFIDAFFESVSGFTTTGASVLKSMEDLPRGLLFWRSFTQWIGGMGIIVFAIAVLPQLSVGGMQLMKNEMPGPTFEQLKPRIKQTALSLWKIYLLFSVLEVFLLCLFGMPLFESLCHMFSTVSTGGFSPHTASVGFYQRPIFQYVIALFMFLAGINFVLHYAVLHGNFKKMFGDTEMKFYFGLTFVAFLVVAVDLALQNGQSWGLSFQQSLFQVISITTTSGFVTADFDAWPHLSKGLLFLLMFVGGCAGSTGGGMKQVRLLLLFKMARQSVVQHIFPKAIVSVKLNKRVIPEAILHGVSSFFLIYIVIFSFCTLALLVYNIDFITATSAVVACLSNVGPGFGLVGAAQNYAFLPGLIKLLLCACMIIGRLEIFTVLVLFFPAAWKR